VTGSVIIGKGKCCFDEMQITDRSAFFECSNKKLPVRILYFIFC